MKTSRIPK